MAKDYSVPLVLALVWSRVRGGVPGVPRPLRSRLNPMIHPPIAFFGLSWVGAHLRFSSLLRGPLPRIWSLYSHTQLRVATSGHPSSALLLRKKKSSIMFNSLKLRKQVSEGWYSGNISAKEMRVQEMEKHVVLSAPYSSMREQDMEEHIVIVGGGIAGLTTALGLHRFQVGSSVSGVTSENESPDANEGYESRCIRRKELLETLERELPHGTIWYLSKVVSIEGRGYHKFLHLADGSTLKAKVLIGCDGVNSLVAKCLGLHKPVYSGRSAVRGFVGYPDGHGFQPRIHFHFGGGVRYGYVPCDDKCLYWFRTYSSSLHHDEEMQENPAKMKQFVLNKISQLPQQAAAVVEMTELDIISCSPLRLRLPWNLLFGNISKGNVCVAGDALHLMTPDIGQGGCSALEDGVVLARCLGEALFQKPRNEIQNEEEEYARIQKGLEKFAKERRWRSFSLISAAYVLGFIQERDGKVMRFLREKFLSRFTVSSVWKMADFHCGELSIL